MGTYPAETAGGESIENLHHRDDNDERASAASGYSLQKRGKTLVCITFILEVLILAAVVVLEYFLRWTTVFPIRRQNFSCSDPELSYSEDDRSMTSFRFSVVPPAVIYGLSFCVPPFVMLIGEVGVWAFSDDDKKSIRVCCRYCSVPQVIRRLLRFVGVFVFGMLTLMIFVDIIKLMVGRLRPNFLEVCVANATLCAEHANLGGDEMCDNKDTLDIRSARSSFPSIRSAMTAYAALYLAIYIHGALRTRSVRVLRPFLALVFTMMTLVCGLTELTLNHNYWTDIVVGWIMGLAMAIYLAAYVLYNFREYVSERKMIRLLHGFLVDHQLLNEITQDGKLRLFPFPFHIPRAHAHTDTSPATPYRKFEGIKAQSQPFTIYGQEGAGERYRDRPTPTPAGQPDEHE